MDQFDTLTQHSSLQRSFAVNGVPTTADVSISKGLWMLKRSLSDADADALVSLSVTSSPTAAGVIADNGAGDGSGQVDFVIGNNALNAVTDFDGTYYAVVKVILSDGMAYCLSQYPVKVLRGGIQSVA